MDIKKSLTDHNLKSEVVEVVQSKYTEEDKYTEDFDEEPKYTEDFEEEPVSESVDQSI